MNAQLAFTVEDLRRRRPEEVLALLAAEPDQRLVSLLYDWDFWARPNQRLPAGDWVYWFIRAGRGWGKTRVGAETTRVWVRGFKYVNLIGATADDARDIMVEGESGILTICPPDERPYYNRSARRLSWPNGAISLIFTADEPERLRGKQHEKLWCDEPAAWRYPEAWDQAKFGLRLGHRPQAVLTSTPKPTQLIKEIEADPATIVTHGITQENELNLARKFISIITKRYEGTRLGRQELGAEILDDNPGALFKRAIIDADRLTKERFLAAVKHGDIVIERVVVGVDPNASADLDSPGDSDECGIVTCARATHRDGSVHGYCLRDSSAVLTPAAWGRAAVRDYHDHEADRIVGEENNGGDMVEATIRNVDEDVAYKGVHATRGKMTRAEPVGALSEQHRLHHVGAFPELEDQLCEYNPLTYKRSPDRLDAYVWAFTELFSKDPAAGWIEFARREAVKAEARQPKGLAVRRSDPNRPGLHFNDLNEHDEDPDAES